MGHQRHNTVKHTFFPATKVAIAGSTEDLKKPVFVDVGGTGDCGFRSIAAGIIDNFLNQPMKMRGDLLKQVLTHHFKYFPQHRITMPGLITPVDRMDQLIRTTHMGELVQTFAYTLRQMAVDELCLHPEYYRGAFVTEHEETSPAVMRQPTTWIDESSIAALSNTLQMPVDVFIGANHTLRKRLRYNEDAINPGVVIRLQGAHYIPSVHSSDRFALVKSQTQRVLKPQVDVNEADPSLADILTKIAAEDQRLITVFDATCHRLKFMVANGELSKENLFSIYIKGMSHSDYLSNRAKHASVEHGHQQFFNLITHGQTGKDTFSVLDDQMTDELIHAISRAISIGHMSDESLDIQTSPQHLAP